MLCEGCGQKDASVHLSDVVDGQKKTVRLCERCAAEKGFAIDPESITKAATETIKMIAPLMVPVLQSLQAAMPDSHAPPAMSCPSCGITWAEFKKTSRFGCAQDYDVFGEAIPRLLKKIHGADRHAGRAPEQAQVRLTRQKRLTELRGELELAVKAEDYEKAARLRDKIRQHELGEDAHRGAV